MSRLLIVPAAGLGSRLGGAVPKVLVKVAGVPMLDRILNLYAGVVDRAVVVLNPAFAADVGRHIAARTDRDRIDTLIQQAPTGMLDAILLASSVVVRVAPSSVWVTWCDQVAVHSNTIERLAALTSARPDDAVVMPTVTRAAPYIHLQRDGGGQIARVLHRREGDAMPDVGESDMGLFALSASAYREMLPAYAAEVQTGQTTGERNFLPFIPWAARRSTVTTFPCEHPMEAVGVNTPDELRAVEAYLAG
jgi:bifunctional N-acetylglucosamine-1-phosphate-uridyltransferase/glucosamine-1-phosphate-acetyltransferase GlmU-like protein